MVLVQILPGATALIATKHNSVWPLHIPAAQPFNKCIKALVPSLISDWSTVMDRRKPADVTFLDFYRAFDKVQPKKLLHSVQEIVHLVIVPWSKSFLSGKIYEVKVEAVFP